MHVSVFIHNDNCHKQLKRILTDLYFNVGVNKIILKKSFERERERGWMTCLRFYVLYIISVSSDRRKGDNGKQCAMKSRLQLKRFPSPASVGNYFSGQLNHQASA